MWIEDVATENGLEAKKGTHEGLDGTAVFNFTGEERFILEKRWSNGNKVFLAFMMNPSHASELSTDPTVDRMIKLAQSNGCDALQVINVASIIDGNSGNLSETHFIMSKINAAFIKKAMEKAHIIFISWGVKGQQGINTWLKSSNEAVELFKKAKPQLYAFEVLTASKEKINYVPHPKPLGRNIKKYIEAPINKLENAEYNKLFMGVHE